MFTFSNDDEQHPVRVIVDSPVGEPVWIGRDVCDVVGISKYRDALAQLDGDERVSVAVDTPGGRQQATAVTEAGVWSLLLISRSPKVKPFKRWLTHKVLPQIRRTGQFVPEPELPAMPTHSEALRGWADELERRQAAEAERDMALEWAAELEPTAAAWTQLAESSGDYEVADAAKVLSRDPKISIGRDRLFRFMCSEGWIYRGSSGRWRIYQAQVDNGRLVEKVGKPFWHEGRGEMVVPDPTVRITPKGLAELHKRLGGTAQQALVVAS
ncbi:hypothetical protein A5695_15315 [Mycobacterium sp. E1747]|nr:hypothetical protein A5695_15315 [Mycobacterium sp. E1747]